MATSPFPASFSKPGEGHLIARLLPNKFSGLVKATFQYPLKIITPPSPVGDLKSALAFLLTYGGGLVAGDQVNLKVRINFIVYQMARNRLVLLVAYCLLSHVSYSIHQPQPRTPNMEFNIPPDRRPPLCQTHPSNSRPHKSLQIRLTDPPILPNTYSHPPRLLRAVPPPRPGPALCRLRLCPIPNLHSPPNRNSLPSRLGDGWPHLPERKLGFHILVWSKRGLARGRR